jgi:acetyltransferase EpsM
MVFEEQMIENSMGHTILTGIVIGGTGGCARETYCHSGAGSPFKKVTAFFDDVYLDKDVLFEKIPIYHDLTLVPKENAFVVAIGDPKARESVVNKFTSAGFSSTQLIAGYVGKDVFIGEGTIIFAQTFLTTNIIVGNHCVISHLSSIGHDCVIEDFVTISALVAVSGNVKIGRGTYIGAGASIREKVTIGKNVMVGMGAVVVKDVPDNVVIAGNPAKVLRENNGQ